MFQQCLMTPEGKYHHQNPSESPTSLGILHRPHFVRTIDYGSHSGESCPLMALRFNLVKSCNSPSKLIKPPFSYGFHGFPIVFLWVFPWFSPVSTAPQVRLRAQLLRLGGAGHDPRLRHLRAHLHGGHGAWPWAPPWAPGAPPGHRGVEAMENHQFLVDFPMKNCDFPMKNCDFPMNKW